MKKLSRREILSMGATAFATGMALRKNEAHASDRGGSGGVYEPFRSYNPPRGGERPYWEKSYSGGPVDIRPLPPVLPGKGYKPVVVPNGRSLPFKIVDEVKVFHLISEEVEHYFDSGLRAKCWGYNGGVTSTVIEAVEGERVRIYVTNHLPASTSVHWHGFNLPNGMDGVGGLTQPMIKPGETFKYEFTLRQYGTQMFHSHHDEMTQMGMGLLGMFVIHPRNPRPEYHVERDFTLMISEWRIDPGTYRPNTLEMTDFNVLTINGKVFPSTAPLICKTGDKVRIRFANLGATDHHPMHLHGHHFRVTATDGEEIPLSAQWPETTVLVGVGQSRNIEFIADAPGDWALHCHMTHHIMNQMGHEFPNMVGVDPGDFDKRIQSLLPGYMTMGSTGMDMGEHREVMPMPRNTISMKGTAGPFGHISMGGLVTILKVRDQLKSYDEDPAWHKHPAGTVALQASDEELRRDGIDVSNQRVNGGSRPTASKVQSGHKTH
jgi:hypothetical protein